MRFLKAILSKLPIPRIDRMEHFFYGTLIFLVLNLLISEFLALIAIISIAFLKEVYDVFKEEPTGFDVIDAFYTILAPILIYIIF